MIPAHKGETDRQMKLIPPDKKRCQCIKQEVNPWAFGIASPVRCKNKPTVIIKERAKPYIVRRLCLGIDLPSNREPDKNVMAGHKGLSAREHVRGWKL